MALGTFEGRGVVGLSEPAACRSRGLIVNKPEVFGGGFRLENAMEFVVPKKDGFFTFPWQIFGSSFLIPEQPPSNLEGV